MLNRKMNEMKKGGYTLFSDKTRKMLLAVGLSMLSVGALATSVNAAPTITPEFKKTVNEDVGDTNITYQLTLKENGAGLHIDDLYYSTDGTTYNAVPVANKLVWQSNESGTEILAVVKVPAEVTHFKLVNDKDTPEEVVLQVSGATNTDGITIDNVAPVPSWFYKNKEGNYIQFEATDTTKIYRVADDEDINRVRIDEKDQDKLLTAKYELREGDEKFYIYDILGNRTEVSIEDIDITYTIAAKNTDGTTVVLNMKLPDGATVTEVTTVEGVDITTSVDVTKDEKGDEGDNLVAVYTNVPEGTTYVNVKYKLAGEDTELILPVALDLDLKSPVIVQRNITDPNENEVADGAIVKTGGTARAYKNKVAVLDENDEPVLDANEDPVTTSTKAIVEVCDFGSAITKIVACTGTGADIVESTALNQTFDIEYLPTSVLQLVDLPENATYIRVYDGIGNKYDIDLAEAVTVDDNTNPVELTIERDGDHVDATFRDRQAGIQKLVRATADTAADKTVNTDEADVSFIPGAAGYQSLITANDITNYYPVTEQIEALPITKLQGVPQMTAVDVFGNTETKNLNDVLFEKTYIYVDVDATDDTDNSQYIAVKVSDARRIKKITATVIEDVNGTPTEVEKILDVFELGQATSEVPEISGPIDLDKVYEIGNGIQVTKVTVYHYNGDVTQNVIELDAQDQVAPTELTDFVEIEENSEDEDKYDVRVTYGIRKIEYSDGCEIEFFEDFPKEVSVHTKDKDNVDLTYVIITDGLGYTYDLMDETTRTTYAP